MAILAKYLFAVLAIISPHLAPARREAIAQDIAAVTISSERAFDNDSNGQKTGLLLVSLAYWETGKSWASWIDDGRCNDPKWRAAHTALLVKGEDCDGGRAWSMWQVHVPHDSITRGRALVTDRQEAIRAALYTARRSLQMGIGLCGYSGERPSSKAHCPKARRRLEKAQEWAESYPFEGTVTVELASK